MNDTGGIDWAEAVRIYTDRRPLRAEVARDPHVPRTWALRTWYGHEHVDLLFVNVPDGAAAEAAAAEAEECEYKSWPPTAGGRATATQTVNCGGGQ